MAAAAVVTQQAFIDSTVGVIPCAQTIIGSGTYGIVMRCSFKNGGKACAAKVSRRESSIPETSILREIINNRSMSDSIFSILRCDRVFVGDKLHLRSDLMATNLRVATNQTFKRRIPVTVFARIAWSMVSALSYLHSKLLIHHDLSLANIMVQCDVPIDEALFSETTTYRVGDFGTMTGPFTALVNDESHCTTPDFAAPEVISSNIDFHHRLLEFDEASRADVWSMSMILFYTIKRCMRCIDADVLADICGALIDNEEGHNCYERLVTWFEKTFGMNGSLVKFYENNKRHLWWSHIRTLPPSFKAPPPTPLISEFIASLVCSPSQDSDMKSLIHALIPASSLIPCLRPAAATLKCRLARTIRSLGIIPADVDAIPPGPPCRHVGEFPKYTVNVISMLDSSLIQETVCTPDVYIDKIIDMALTKGTKVALNVNSYVRTLAAALLRTRYSKYADTYFTGDVRIVYMLAKVSNMLKAMERGILLADRIIAADSATSFQLACSAISGCTAIDTHYEITPEYISTLARGPETTTHKLSHKDISREMLIATDGELDIVCPSVLAGHFAFAGRTHPLLNGFLVNIYPVFMVASSLLGYVCVTVGAVSNVDLVTIAWWIAAIASVASRRATATVDAGVCEDATKAMHFCLQNLHDKADQSLREAVEKVECAVRTMAVDASPHCRIRHECCAMALEGIGWSNVYYLRCDFMTVSNFLFK